LKRNEAKQKAEAAEADGKSSEQCGPSQSITKNTNEGNKMQCRERYGHMDRQNQSRARCPPHQRHGELQRYARVQRPRLIFPQNNCSCRSMPNEKDCRASTAHQRQTEETKRPEKSNAETISKIEQVAGSRQHHKAVAECRCAVKGRCSRKPKSGTHERVCK
jgi:hypothetical protein